MFIAFNIRSFRITNLLFSRDTQGSGRILRCRLKSDSPSPFTDRDLRCCRASRFFRRNRISKGSRCFTLRVPFIDSDEASAAPSSLSLSPSPPSLSPPRRWDPRGQERVYNGLTGYRRGPGLNVPLQNDQTDQTRVTNTTCIFPRVRHVSLARVVTLSMSISSSCYTCGMRVPCFFFFFLLIIWMFADFSSSLITNVLDR